MDKVWFNNLPTKKKIRLSLAAPLSLMVLVGIIGLVALWSINRTSGWVNHTYEVLLKSQDVIAHAVDMETGMRGFLLAGREEFLDPYKSGEAQVYAQIADLKNTVSDNPGQMARLDEVRTVLEDWQTDVTEPQIQLRRDIGDAPTMNDISRIVGEARGKQYFDGFRAQFAEFIATEERLLDERRTELETQLGASGQSSEAAVNAIGWVEHTYRVIGAAQNILAAAVDMETGMRGYLLAGNEEFLEPYDQGTQRFWALTDELKSTVDDNPAQVARLEEIEATIAAWVANVVTPIIDLRREIGHAQTMDDMADVIGEARGKQYFDEFRSLIAAFAAEEQSLMQSRQRSQNLTMLLSIVSILITMGIAAAVGLWLTSRVGGSIADPIVNVTEAMKRLINGDHDVTIDGQDREDEVGDIARATQVFQENSRKVEELAKAAAEHARRLEEAATQQREAAEAQAELEREQTAKVRARQDMMSALQTSISDVVEGATRGKFDGRVVADFSDQDLIDLAEAINRLMDVIGDGLGNTANVLTRFAEGDLDVRMEGEFFGAFEELQRNLNTTVDRVSGVMHEISEAADLVNENAGQINGQVSSLLQRTSQQAATIEETSAATEQMSSAIKESSQNTQNARSLAKDASAKAQHGSQVVQNAVNAMGEIEDSSKKVSEILSLIDDIAFQTNLLALNASVEAARAGDAGKGFAVVAAEVRGLAQRSSDASNEIRALIMNSNETIAQGVRHIRETGDALDGIFSSVAQVETVIDQVATSSTEQASTAGEISTAVASFDRAVQENAGMANQTQTNVSQLSQSAEKLKSFLAFFTFDGTHRSVTSPDKTAGPDQRQSA
ncbi:MAG: CHASE3 domain-containing protein [Pseudomonadota bacterium]